MQHNNYQKGVILIMIFLIVTIVAAIALGVNGILFHKVGLIGQIGKPLYSFDAAQSGIEKTLYYSENGGICSIADNCETDAQNPDGGLTNCNNVTTSGSDCTSSCSDCTVTFDATEDGKTNTVSATITDCSSLVITSTGSYGGVSRQVTSNNTNSGSGGSGGPGPLFSVCSPGAPPSI